MYCPQCGKEIIDQKFIYCPRCGSPVNRKYRTGAGNSYENNNYSNNGTTVPSNQTGMNTNYNYVNNNDSGSIGWGILGFFFPLIGLILFLVWKNDKPRNAKRAGIGALISVILSVGIYIIYAIFGAAVMFSL